MKKASARDAFKSFCLFLCQRSLIDVRTAGIEGNIPVITDMEHAFNFLVRLNADLRDKIAFPVVNRDNVGFIKDEIDILLIRGHTLRNVPLRSARWLEDITHHIEIRIQNTGNSWNTKLI